VIICYGRAGAYSRVAQPPAAQCALGHHERSAEARIHVGAFHRLGWPQETDGNVWAAIVDTPDQDDRGPMVNAVEAPTRAR
jgi:hypothetical protein